MPDRDDRFNRVGRANECAVAPQARSLIVYRWTESGYLLVQSVQGEERVRAEPFDAVVLSVHGLLAGDEDEDE